LQTFKVKGGIDHLQQSVMINNKLKSKWPLYALVALALQACYPSEDFFVEELDLVVTNYEEDENYARFTTFAVPDSVIRIGDDGTEEKGPFDDLMLDLVRQNMIDLGYVEELDPENTPPDLVVLVELLITDNTVVAPCWPSWGWWGGWPPYWGPGWCGGWGWVPVGSYTTGTVIIDMLDIEGADMEEEVLPIVWNGLINGLVTGSDASLEQRIRTNINQAFDQSAYLGR
jgi:hypothetical protein